MKWPSKAGEPGAASDGIGLEPCHHVRQQHHLVDGYYGRQLQGTADLRHQRLLRCQPDAGLAQAVAGAHPPGSAVALLRLRPGLPALLDGCRVLDLGCGSGRDVYALAQLVGATGEVVGVDMTDGATGVAERIAMHHAEAFGFSAQRVVPAGLHRAPGRAGPGARQLRRRRLQLRGQPFAGQGCSAARRASPAQARRRVLFLRRLRRPPRAGRGAQRSGAVRRMPGRRAVLERLRRLAHRHGFRRPAPGRGSPARRHRPRPAARVSATCASIRPPTGCSSSTAWRRPARTRPGRDLSRRHSRQPERFVLDKHHDIETGRVFPVCGNTWRMLQSTRLAPHFEYDGRTRHPLRHVQRLRFRPASTRTWRPDQRSCG